MEYSTSQFPTSFDADLLKNKSILITGGASGMGAGFARKFAESGAFVTIADVNREGGMALETELNSSTTLGAKFVHCDVTSWKSQTEAFKTAISSSPTKTLDTVVAAAGIAGDIFDTTLKAKNENDEEDPPEPPLTCLKVNLLGVYYTAQLACHYMGHTPEASTSIEKSMILVGSLAGYHAVVRSVEYTSGKYGVRGILKSLRTETEAIGLRLNIIAPTYIRTPLVAASVFDVVAKAGVQFAKVETAVEAVMVLATHTGIHGRAIAIGANGNFDLKDDNDGLNAGPALENYAKEMGERREKAGLDGSERFFFL